MKNYIKGKYKKNIYSNELGYTIGLFKANETNNEEIKNKFNTTITFVGYFADLNFEDEYIFYGEIIKHKKFGYQFEVESYEKVKITDKESLIEYFSSSLFNGIGKSLAKNIVDTLKENCINEILSKKEQLNLVPKLTQKKIDIIYDTLKKEYESHEIIIKICSYGFNMKEAIKIYNFYKNKSIAVINANPYLLIRDVDINFKRIDSLFKEINKDSRIDACIIYCMKELLFKNGDTYLHKDEIQQTTNNYLQMEIPQEIIKQHEDITVIDEKYYLTYMYEQEKYISSKLCTLLKFCKKINLTIDNYYDESQKKAITTALSNNLTIITGGPGTGKTTIIKGICDFYTKTNSIESLALLAPTGRASRRMMQTTNLKASTIHKFLQWNKDTNEFSVNSQNPSKVKFVIIDEVSMVDQSLLFNLLKGLSDDIKIVLVGDINQLPSVGSGQILKDLINSEVVDTIYLSKLYRQDDDSYINTLAYEIKDNDLTDFKQQKSDYRYLECDNHSIPKNLKIICQKLKENYDYKNLQILAPMYAGNNGIDNLNSILQQVFNPQDNKKNELSYNNQIYRENDKVIQLVNDSEKNITNGDIGKIISIYNNEIQIDFEGIKAIYTPSELVNIKLAYVISIHKSQGSEFDFVILPICNSHKIMLDHKLLYTAVTRAKRKLIIIGQTEAFLYCVSRKNEVNRKTTLSELIVNNILNT